MRAGIVHVRLNRGHQHPEGVLGRSACGRAHAATAGHNDPEAGTPILSPTAWRLTVDASFGVREHLYAYPLPLAA